MVKVCTKEDKRKGAVVLMVEETTELYTFEEARAVLRTSKTKMRKLLDDKEIPAFKIGKYNWLIPKKAIAEYIEKMMLVVE